MTYQKKCKICLCSLLIDEKCICIACWKTNTPDAYEAQLATIEQRHAEELTAAEARSSDYGVMYAAGEVEALRLDGIPPQEFKGRLESLVVDTQKYLEQREATITKAAEARGAGAMKEAAAFVPESIGNWLTAKTIRELPAPDTKAYEATITKAARVAALGDAAKAICPYCNAPHMWRDAFEVPELDLCIHKPAHSGMTYSGEHGQPCKAKAIRALIDKEVV